MGVDHCGFYVFVSEKFLHSSYIVTILKEMRGEGVAEGVRGDSFVNFCQPGCLANCLLKGCLSLPR